ncbi:MAG: septal ring lytic transglycosylase RlpA family protein [Crocinitomicaceae bacterium]
MIFKQSLPYLLILFALAIPSQEPFIQTGKASFYADKFHNRHTTSGEKYDKNAYTAAHKTLPFGTILLVTNLKNDSTVLVKINDRLGSKKRIIDLSKAAAMQLNFIRDGIANVRIEEVLPEPKIIESNTSMMIPTVEAPLEMTENVLMGKDLMDQNCIHCHKLHAVNDFSQAKWAKVLPNMAKKANITPEAEEKINAYVQWKLQN